MGIRAARNISGFGLPPGITRAERREVAKIIESALSKLSGELSGKYYSLETLSKGDSDAHLFAKHPQGHRTGRPGKVLYYHENAVPGRGWRAHRGRRVRQGGHQQCRPHWQDRGTTRADH